MDNGLSNKIFLQGKKKGGRKKGRELVIQWETG